MTMNSTGAISLAGTTAGVSIEIENGGNGTTQISLNDSSVRTLAGVASGAIAMPTDFWGKANTYTIEYLIVGGGGGCQGAGGAGWQSAGGGGGGGVLNTTYTISPGTVATITVAGNSSNKSIGA